MSDLVIPGTVLTALGLLFAIVRYALHGYREARQEFSPRSECVLKHSLVDSRLLRAEADIATEARARHDLRDALQPIALKVAKLEASMEGVQETVSETRDLVKALVSRE